MRDVELNLITVNMHDFKTNFSKYLRQCETKERDFIFVKRNNKYVGAFLTMARFEAIVASMK